MNTPPPRSPRLLASDRSALVIVDVQEKLLPAMANKEQVLSRTLMLAQAAQLIGVPAILTEQYPKGLGATVSALAEHIENRVTKMEFSAAQVEDLNEWLEDAQPEQVVVAGLEAHVCVLQTALDLDAQGFDVFVVADAVGSRRAEDKDIALQRLAQAGLTLTTTESVTFEWLQTAQADKFKAVSALLKAAG